MRMASIIPAVLVALLSASLYAAGSDSPDKGGKGGEIDELEVMKLIQQMSDRNYKVRQRAQDLIEAMGPRVVPFLYRYRKHDDPEVRIRVQTIIDSYKWLMRGAIVTKVYRKSSAERKGVKMGDVVVKVNDTDITRKEDLNGAPWDKDDSAAYTLLRDGRIFTVELMTMKAEGKFKIRISDWDFAKGGKNHSRAIAAMGRGRYKEAFRRLEASRAEGMDHLYSLMLLFALAEYNLDHEKGMEYYQMYRKRVGDANCYLSHALAEEEYCGLPVSGAHTAWLLKMVKEQKDFSPVLYHQLDSYFLLDGRNFPLLKKYSARNWPKGAQYTTGHRYWHARGRMEVALFERRWNDVLTDLRLYPNWHHMLRFATIAAVNAGKLDEACEMSLRVIEQYRKGQGNPSSASVAKHVIAAAAAAGRDDLIDKLLDGLAGLTPEQREYVIGVAYSWTHGAVLPKVRSFLDKTVTSGKQRYLSTTMLNSMRYSPGLTLQEWRKAFDKYGRPWTKDANVRWQNAMALLRLGHYDEAERQVKDFPSWRAGVVAFRKAASFLRTHADRLEKDWAPLKGVFQMYDGKEKGSYWAVQYDGKTLYISPSGKIVHFPGLAPGQLHRARCGDLIRVSGNETVYVRRTQVYLFDEKHKRWTATFTSPCCVPASKWLRKGDGVGATVRCVHEHYPWRGRGREFLQAVGIAGDYVCSRFNGDIALAVNTGTGKTIDLGKQIGRLAGGKKPAAVYKLGTFATKTKEQKLLCPTNVGMWTLDARGKIERIDLGLKDPDVMVVEMPYPRRHDGIIHIGVVPQQGGQVFAYDTKTGKTSLTKGYCGLGPDDSFAAVQKFFWPVFCETAIQRMYEKRLASEKAKPARRTDSPATGAAGATGKNIERN